MSTLVATLLCSLLLACTTNPRDVVAGFGDSLTSTACCGSFLDFLYATRTLDLGVAGQSTIDGLPRLVAWLDTPEATPVGTVTILMGTNDVSRSDYRQQDTLDRLATMIEVVHAHGKRAVWITPPPIFAPDLQQANDRIDRLAAAIVRYANQWNLICVDLHGIVETYPDPVSLYRPDEIHLNLDDGDRLAADWINVALKLDPRR